MYIHTYIRTCIQVQHLHSWEHSALAAALLRDIQRHGFQCVRHEWIFTGAVVFRNYCFDQCCKPLFMFMYVCMCVCMYGSSQGLWSSGTIVLTSVVSPCSCLCIAYMNGSSQGLWSSGTIVLISVVSPCSC